VRRRTRVVGAAFAAAVLLTSCASTFGFPHAGDAQGRDIDDLWRVSFWASVGVAAIVYGLILWSILRYRARGRTDAPPQFRQHLGLEITYTAIPILIVAVLFVVTVRTERSVLSLSPAPARTVHVDAYAWGWRFSYDGTGIVVASTPNAPGPQLVLPQGEPTRIVLTSSDVVHSFFVPGFLFKRDAIPGRVTEFQFTPERAGTYEGACAEFCGLNHAFMRFSVRVVSSSAFASWVAEQQASAGASPSPEPSPGASP